MFESVLYAFLLVTGVGLLAAILLSLVSKFFAVRKDERESEIRTILPGVNCGACGYKGCDDYAKHLAAGVAAPNLCTPGGADVASQLASYLGVTAGEVEKKVAFVHCNGTKEAAKGSFAYDGMSSCRAASALFGGQYSCKFGCLGFGDCAKACPNDAICLTDGIARVLPERCIGCGICRDTCPKALIELVPASAAVAVFCHSCDRGGEAKKACDHCCIGCKKCEKACPSGAIKVENNLAKIDPALCTGCGLCASACPTGCIKLLPQHEAAEA